MSCVLTPRPLAAPPPMAVVDEIEPLPDGFLTMKVLGVLPTDGGHAVFLVNEKKGVMVPIWIGPSEAMAIQLRLDRKRFRRPLTHDLLDSLVKELDGTITKVHVDDLRSNTFVSTIFVRTPVRKFSVDARASDAIALALGNRVPIFVANSVVEHAGIEAGSHFGIRSNDDTAKDDKDGDDEEDDDQALPVPKGPDRRSL